GWRAAPGAPLPAGFGRIMTGLRGSSYGTLALRLPGLRGARAGGRSGKYERRGSRGRVGARPQGAIDRLEQRLVVERLREERHRAHVEHLTPEPIVAVGSDRDDAEIG